jgi:hypothetical protein
MLMSSSSVRTASTTIPRSVLRRASASGTAGVESAEQVSALAPEEGRPDDLGPIDAIADPGRPELGGDAAGGEGGIATCIGVGRVPAEVAEHGLDEAGEVSNRPVGAIEAVGRLDRGNLEVGVDELDVRVDTEGREDAPGDRVEERFRELGVLPAGDQPGVDGLGPRPDDGVRDPFGENGPNVPLDVVDDRAVEVKPLGRVLGGALPVAALEACLGAPGDLVECFAMALERLGDGDRGQVRQPAGRELARGLPCHGSQRRGRAGRGRFSSCPCRR